MSVLFFLFLTKNNMEPVDLLERLMNLKVRTKLAPTKTDALKVSASTFCSSCVIVSTRAF